MAMTWVRCDISSALCGMRLVLLHSGQRVHVQKGLWSSLLNRTLISARQRRHTGHSGRGVVEEAACERRGGAENCEEEADDPAVLPPCVFDRLLLYLSGAGLGEISLQAVPSNFHRLPHWSHTRNLPPRAAYGRMLS